MSDVLTTSVVIGAAGAGLRRAIAVAETNPALRVAIVSKVYPMRSHTVSAEGGAAAVAADDDTLDEHAYDTVSGSDWLCDQDAVEAFVAEAPRELLRLEHWGCPWSRQPDGRIAVRAFGGMKKMRTWFAADRTGFHLLHTLFQTALSYPDIVRYDEWYVTKILVDDGRAYGVVAIELATGRIETITASAVIVCTGGCGRVYPFTTNANIKTGDGMALAYRAGAALKDMEFVQYHPTGLPFTGILITEAARAEGGWLLNKDGYRYLQDYDLGTPSPTPVHAQHGARAAGPVVPGLRARAGEGPARSTRRTGRSCTWTCGIWARSSSTPSCRSSGSCARSTRTSTRSRSWSRSARSCTT